MSRITVIDNINHFLSLFTLEVEKYNSVNLYDINIHAETIAIPLLNAIFGCDLTNANLIERNFPAVDLVDYENRVAIQVTSTGDSEKISYTINKFREKGLHNDFDVLMVYILTRKNSYRTDFASLAGSDFYFDANEHIFDNNDLFKKVQGNTNLALLRKIRDHLEIEFASDKQAEREKLITQEVPIAPPEPYILNFVGLTIPQTLYIAPFDLNDQRERLTDEIQSFRKNQKRKKRSRRWISDRDLMRKAIADAENGFCHDWVLFKKSVVTFRDLNNPSEILRPVIDTKAIESIDAEDFWTIDEDHLRVFKNLVGMSLRQKFLRIGLEWEHEQEIFRFRASKALTPIKVTWKKDKRNATREVFSEVMDEAKSHVVCFRHLGFSTTQEVFEDEWYLTIKPSWSFTSNGQQRSRFSPSYSAKLKRMEQNGSVHNHFRFIADYIAKDRDIEAPKSVQTDEEESTDSYEITIKQPLFFDYSPSIIDTDWLPEKQTK